MTELPNIDNLDAQIKEWLRELRLEDIDPGPSQRVQNYKNPINTSPMVTNPRKPQFMKNFCLRFRFLKYALPIFTMSLCSQFSFAGIGEMSQNLQNAILDVLAPMICVGGLIFSAFKLAMGDESAKRALFWSCIGTILTYSAPSILSYLHHNVAA